MINDFFFSSRRRHTRSKRDWSSDVCSSDLPEARETGEYLPGVPNDLLQRALASGRSFADDREAGMIVMTLQLEHDLIGVLRAGAAHDDRIDDEAIQHVAHYLNIVSSVVGTSTSS